jgi:Phosphotransferase enzyme family
MENGSQLSALTAPMLQTIVPRALGHAVDAIGDWHVRPLSGGWESTTSIHLVSGHAHARGTTVPWHLVLKIIRATADRLDAQHWNYWKREPLAYQSGILSALPGGLAAPQVYAVVEHTDQSVWVWLEVITDTAESPWTLATYGVVAQQFGQFNGAYLTGRPAPTGAWVSHGWLRNYVTAYAPVIERLPSLEHHPLVSRAIPAHFVGDLVQLCTDRGRLLAALDQLPQTFCHLDAWRWNLFLTATPQGQPQVVAVDWAFVGVGALGQELAPLIFSNRSDPALEAHALHHYLMGLRAAGWHGDEQLVYLGYTATLALVYGLALIGFCVDALLDERQHAFLEQGFGESLDQLVVRYASWMEFALPRAEQARRLLAFA